MAEDVGDGGIEKTAKPSTNETLAVQATSFEALEKDFREVLNELVGDKSLERFRSEYEKLHDALRKSQDNERKLIKKCRELNSELVVNAQKVQQALRMSLADQKNIKLLKKEIDNAWKFVDSAKEKESQAKETIKRLSSEIEKLSKLVDQGAGLSIGQENAVNELVRERERLQGELAAQQEQASKDQLALKTALVRIQELEQAKLKSEQSLNDRKNEVVRYRAEAEQESRRAERLQKETMSLKQLNEERKQRMQDKDEEYDLLLEEKNAIDLERKEMEYAIEKYREVADELRAKNGDLEHDIERLLHNESNLAMEKQAAYDEIALKKEQLRKKTAELMSVSRRRDKLESEKERLAHAKREAERQRDTLKHDLNAIHNELELQSRNADTDEKLIKDLQQQILRLTNSLASSKERNKLHVDIVKQAEEVKKSLEADIIRHKKEEETLRKRNYELEKQREKAAMTASNNHNRVIEQKEVIRMREMEIDELKKKVQDERHKLKMQQTLYEQVRADRNLFNKQHIQSQDEIAEMKRKFKIMSHQIEQLKEEIRTKDQALVNEHYAYKRLKDETKVLRRKTAKRDEVLGTADQVLASQDTEIKNLRRTLMEAEQAQRQQKKVYDNVVQERDILGTQLVRRNDELALLYEKIRIQQTTLSKGELQYRERLKEINLLKLKINDMKRELLIKSTETDNVDALKSEVHNLQQDLLQEKTKVKALSEELENPMNVHRWRKLEGSDPQKYDLLRKIQTLQKRLIQKTEEVVEKDLMLKEREKLYQELKHILARQPGPEVAEQLSVYQHSLKERSRQMKGMAAEMNMLQAQANEYRAEVDRLTRELQDTKRRYYEQRKREHAQSQSSSPRWQQAPPHLLPPKIAGGGFNLSQSNQQPQIPPTQVDANALKEDLPKTHEAQVQEVETVQDNDVGGQDQAAVDPQAVGADDVNAPEPKPASLSPQAGTQDQTQSQTRLAKSIAAQDAIKAVLGESAAPEVDGAPSQEAVGSPDTDAQNI